MTVGISSSTTVDYLLDGDSAESPEAGAAASRGKSRQLRYYTDGELTVSPTARDLGHAPGLWWCHGKGLGGVKTGDPLDAAVLRELCDDNFDRATGRTMTQGGDRAGHDVVFSAPKSVSLAWAFGTRKQRDAIAALQERAATESLTWLLQQGGAECRTGKAGAGPRLVAESVVAGIFSHGQSRQLDPQLHTHAFMPNKCLCSDGVYRSLDMLVGVQYKYALDQHYKSILASGLREMGFSIEAHDKSGEHGFEIAGVPKEIIDLFSKQTGAIQALAAALGIDTALDRKAAQIIAKQTRPDKERVPLTELLERWRAELASVGWTPEALVDHMLAYAVEPDTRTEAERDAEARANVLGSASRGALSKGILRYSEVAAEALKLSQRSGDKNRTLKAIDEAIKSGDLLLLGRKDGHEYLCSKEFAHAEQEYMSIARESRGSWKGRLDAALEALEAREAEERAKPDGKPMALEQHMAARHMLGPDGFSLVEGDPGTGKSFLTQRLLESCAQLDFARPSVPC